MCNNQKFLQLLQVQAPKLQTTLTIKADKMSRILAPSSQGNAG